MTCQKGALNRKLSLGFWLTNQVSRHLSIALREIPRKLKRFCRLWKRLKKEQRLTRITVVTDAAMPSKNKVAVLDIAGYPYIVGSRLQKIPDDTAEYRKKGK